MMPRNLFAILDLEFPDGSLILGSHETCPRRPRDAARLRRNLAAAAERLRRRSHVVVGAILVWVGALLVTALLTRAPYAAVAAMGAMGGGMVWSMEWLHRIHRELSAVELLLAAIDHDASYLDALVQDCRAWLKRPERAPAGPKARTAAAGDHRAAGA